MQIIVRNYCIAKCKRLSVCSWILMNLRAIFFVIQTIYVNSNHENVRFFVITLLNLLIIRNRIQLNGQCNALDYNKSPSKEECPVKKNSESSNSKTPKSRYASNNNQIPSTIVINRHNIDGKRINSTKNEMTLLLRRRLPWLMIELYLNNHSFTTCATFSEKATFIAH